MEKLPETTGTLGWAESYALSGWPIIPLVGKVPAVTSWQRFVATPVSLRYWFGNRRCNVGLRTGESGYVVVDTDTQEADAWAARHLPETPMQALSGNGSRHRYYQTPPGKEVRNRQGWNRIRGLDVRGHGGYIVLPGSIHPATGRPYQWTTDVWLPSGLPAFSGSWVHEETRTTRAALKKALDGDGLLGRARRYMRTIEPAVSGAGGHTKTFTTALKLARVVNYDADLLWVLLCEYNVRCLPPWSEGELRHKWVDALKRRRP